MRIAFGLLVFLASIQSSADQWYIPPKAPDEVEAVQSILLNAAKATQVTVCYSKIIDETPDYVIVRARTLNVVGRKGPELGVSRLYKGSCSKIAGHYIEISNDTNQPAFGTFE